LTISTGTATTVETRRVWTRANVLPLAAGAFLLAGAACWLWARLGNRPHAGAIRDGVWYAGLLLTGVPVVVRTLMQAARGHLATDLVAALAVGGSVALGEPLAGLVIVLMQTGGEALERYAEGRASAAVRELEAAAPRIAHRMHDDAIEDIPAEQVRIGDVFIVRPGELVPCDGLVLEGQSAVDVSRLTGEPLPLEVSAGSELQSGTGNGEGQLTVRATAIARESQYYRIVELVRSAEESKAPFQRLADRYAIWFTPATLLVCAVAWMWSGDPRRALAVLVVATPCPLILATPIAIIGGINRAARRQVIVRNGGALEQIGTTTVVVLDKTGTLTIGRPAVARVLTRGKWTERELLRLAGGVEQGSGHLLARTLVEAAQLAAREIGGVLPRASDIAEAPGAGVTGHVEGHEVVVGARTLISDRYPKSSDDLRTLDACFDQDAGLRAFVAIDGEVAGAVEYADHLRDDARAVLRELEALGYRRILLLSGDHEANVRKIADEAGIVDARADLRPQDKAAIIRQLEAEGERVLMIGDGTNDAPAMSTATVGVSLAAHGGGITAEAAGIVVLADELSRVPEAIRISRRTIKVARQSLALGLGLSGVAMLFALLGFIPPPVGALLQELIDVAAILNALRAARPDRAVGNHPTTITALPDCADSRPVA
jgi:heavy metal translocating P-type ATPase